MEIQPCTRQHGEGTAGPWDCSAKTNLISTLRTGEGLPPSTSAVRTGTTRHVGFYSSRAANLT